MSRLLAPLFSTPALDALLDDRARLRAMLDVEAALARAQAQAGLVPQAAVGPIEACCHAELFDLDELAQGTALAGNPAIPMVKRLTALVAQRDPEAARYVHWGATSQDIMNTGLVLQLRAVLGLVRGDLDRLVATLADLARTHRDTPMIGRTLLQQAIPITFGLKAAGWLDALLRHRERLMKLEPRLFVIQFGGAAGTLASLGDKGNVVAQALARELDLGCPDLPWHGGRDRIVELATVLGLLVGTLGKMARDWSLMTQTEVGELKEPGGPGRGGSSTMPHKRNPVAASAVLSAAVRTPGLVATMLAAMPQEHERGLGGWQAEWETLPQLCRLAGGALAQTKAAIEGLEVDAPRMRANLETTRGLVMAEAVQMALAEKLGKLEAHDLVEAACHKAVQEGRHLREVLAEEQEVTEHLGDAALDRLFDPLGYVGEAAAFVDAVLARATAEPQGR